MRKLFLPLLLLCLSCEFAAAGTTQPRPVEITSHEIARRANPVVMKSQNLTKWRIESDNIADARLSLSDEAPLWEDQVGMLSFKVIDARKKALITLYPDEKMQLPQGNFIEFWTNGPTLFHANIMLATFRSADGVVSRCDLVGGAHQWNAASYWGNALTAYPPEGKAPWQLQKLEIVITPESGAKADTEQKIFFDEFASHTRTKERIPTAWRKEYPKPTTPDTILPMLKSAPVQNGLRKDGDTYCFSAGQNLTYRYTPHTGTFSDIEVELGDKTRFRLTKDGGPWGEVSGVKILPGDPEVQSRFLSSNVRKNVLMTRWERRKGDHAFTYQLNIEVKQKSLIVSVKGEKPDISLVAAGYTDNTPGLKLIEPSYYNNRHNIPHIAYVHKVFASCTMDWYTSQATSILDDGPDGERAMGSAKVGTDQVRLTDGAIYRQLSDGSRNLVSDRLFITVSEDMDEVLPTIANPPSPLLEVTSKLVCCSRPNFLTSPEEAEKELNFWKKLHAYGVTDVFLRFHMEVMGNPLESNRICREMNTFAGLGDEALHKLLDGMHALGYKVGCYQNHTLFHALSPEYDLNLIALDYNYFPQERWRENNYLPKACALVQIVTDFMPKFKAKWNFDGIYSDEITNNPPYVDYEAGAPGAGMQTEYLYANMLLLQKEREIMQGPIWSEGTGHMYWAGYTDINYAQSNYPDRPLVPNFQLHQLHMLENDTGYDLTVQKTSWDNDYWLASTIIFGNIGHIRAGKGTHSMMAGSSDAYQSKFREITKSYFMMRALQECYSHVRPAEILYADNDGKPVPLAEAVEKGTLANNQVFTRYENGLKVWVNRHASKNWTIDFDGKPLLLPPSGYAAYQDGKITEYSAGNPRTDYVAGELYTYVDGRGTRTDFPEITAAGAYLLRPEDGGIRLIAQGEVPPETIVLKNLKSVSRIDALDRNGEKLSRNAEFQNTAQGTELKIDPAVFQYQIVF